MEEKRNLGSSEDIEETQAQEKNSEIKASPEQLSLENQEIEATREFSTVQAEQSAKADAEKELEVLEKETQSETEDETAAILREVRERSQLAAAAIQQQIESDEELAAADYNHEQAEANRQELLENQQQEEVLRAQQPKHKKRPRKKRSALCVFLRFVLALILVAILTTGAMACVYAGSDILGVNQQSEKASIYIEPSSSVEAISKTLQEKGVIKYAAVFRLYIRFAKDNNVAFNYGNYSINLKSSYDEVIDILEKGEGESEDVIKVTIPEHFNIIGIADTLQQNGVCTRDDFLAAVQNYDTNNPTAGADDAAKESIAKMLSGIEANAAERMYKLEGYLFPDTYQFKRNADPEAVINIMLSTMDKRLTKTMRRQMEFAGLTYDQLLQIASVVQLEAPDKINMLKIADVYLNRLDDTATFPKLQSDPTRKYGEDVILPNGGTQAMADEYNTYVSDGLMPGPINSPGIDAIKSVIYPTASNPKNYFFCSNINTGECFYATTNAEHEVNLVRAGLK